MTQDEELIILDILRRGLIRTEAPAHRMLVRTEDGGAAARPSGPPPGQEARPAAVLVLLYPGAHGLTLVLTRRTSHLPKHAGQISFPGGGVDPGDLTPLHAALREANEELGIEAKDVEVLAELQPVYIPPSNFLVHPFVASANNRPPFRPSPDEVAEVLEVPLAHLLDPATACTEVRELQGVRYLVPYFDYQGHKIWGATAAMLDDLLARIARGLQPPEA